ncbi:MAG: tRNA-intron lyase [Candidatus Hodarchaeota archaeon]
MPTSQPIPTQIVENKVVVWNPADGSKLYGKGFYGKPLGIRKPKTAEFDRPSQLSFFEALHLLRKGIIAVYTTDASTPLTEQKLVTIAEQQHKEFSRKYHVYEDLRRRGFVVRPGLKFGADFAVYRQGPGIDHSLFIVEVIAKSDEVSAIEVVRAGRLATSVRKRFVLATASETGKVRYFIFSWIKP